MPANVASACASARGTAKTVLRFAGCAHLAIHDTKLLRWVAAACDAITAGVPVLEKKNPNYLIDELAQCFCEEAAVLGCALDVLSDGLKGGSVAALNDQCLSAWSDARDAVQSISHRLSANFNGHNHMIDFLETVEHLSQQGCLSELRHRPTGRDVSMSAKRGFAPLTSRDTAFPEAQHDDYSSIPDTTMFTFVSSDGDASPSASPTSQPNRLRLEKPPRPPLIPTLSNSELFLQQLGRPTELVRFVEICLGHRAKADAGVAALVGLFNASGILGWLTTSVQQDHDSLASTSVSANEARELLTCVWQLYDSKVHALTQQARRLRAENVQLANNIATQRNVNAEYEHTLALCSRSVNAVETPIESEVLNHITCRLTDLEATWVCGGRD